MTQFGVQPWLSNPKFAPAGARVPRAVDERQVTERVAAAYARGFSEGHKKGFEEGKQAGFSDGFSQGIERLTSIETALAEPRSQSMAEIAAMVAKKHDVRVADLKGHRRQRHIILARREAMALALADGTRTYPQVGRFFNKDHTTVIHAVRKYAEAESARLKREEE